MCVCVFVCVCVCVCSASFYVWIVVFFVCFSSSSSFFLGGGGGRVNSLKVQCLAYDVICTSKTSATRFVRRRRQNKKKNRQCSRPCSLDFQTIRTIVHS